MKTDENTLHHVAVRVDKGQLVVEFEPVSECVDRAVDQDPVSGVSVGEVVLDEAVRRRVSEGEKVVLQVGDLCLPVEVMVGESGKMSASLVSDRVSVVDDDVPVDEEGPQSVTEKVEDFGGPESGVTVVGG